MDDTTENPISDLDPAEASAPDQDGAEKLQQLLASADDEERERLLRETITTQAARILNTSISDDSNFLQNGLNSLTALELTKTLMTLTGIEIPMVAIVEKPSPAELAHHLSQELAQTAAE